MKLFTIGFTKKTAEEFFTRLKEAGVGRLIDVRLNNRSQLAGFAKKDDLRYFLRAIDNIEYLHLPFLAPTQDLLDAYKKRKGSWSEYEKAFVQLMASRGVEQQLGRTLLAEACLLCSEDLPDKCHRRLLAEYLRDKWGDLEVDHL